MFVILLLIFISVIFIYGNKNYSYWKNRNIKHVKTLPLFGTNFRQYFRLRSVTEMATETYKLFPSEKYVGYYRGINPELVVRDPDLIRQILTSDFLHFYARGLGRDSKIEPMFNNIFHIDGDNWKLLRQRLTPAFTTSKLKNMFNLILECAGKLEKLADNIAEGDGVHDIRELMARYTTDFIGSCGFGVKMDSLNDPNSKFRQIGRKMFTIKFKTAISICLKELFPEVFYHLRASDKDIENAIVNLVETILEQRNYKPVGRHDFIDLMLELKQKGKIVGESLEKVNQDGVAKTVELELDLMIMAAQVFVFFAAGFETSSSATSFTLHQLAYNPDVQKKVQAEIDSVIAKHNGLCYDAMKEMPYLDMTFKESMRIFPSLGVLNRKCMKKYTIPGTDITIDKGVKIIIPVQALQNDEEYWDNPSEFRPERFAPEECNKRHNFVYLPFGEGPRNCIGLRLGHMQSITGLAALLHKFSVEPAPTTLRHPEVDHTTSVVQNIKGGLPLRLIKRIK